MLTLWLLYIRINCIINSLTEKEPNSEGVSSNNACLAEPFITGKSVEKP